MDLCVFSKRLQEMDFGELADGLRGAGFDGVDLTVRPGGHVEPGEVREGLPRAVEELGAGGVTVRMISTSVTDVDAPHARDVLETAAQCGVRWAKLGYWAYDGFGTLRRTMREAGARLRALAAAAGELGIFLGCHNHSGGYVGAHLAHLGVLMEPLDPEAVGIYFDPAHAFLEGGRRGWLQSLDWVTGRVRMLALKDFVVPPGGDLECVPMGRGAIPWAEVVAALKHVAAQLGPVSVHSEKAQPAADALRLAGADREAFLSLWESS
ncbi:MAG: sugar phosphate isomerase/epimerase family protein [Planctomycetota bacterium]